MSNRKTIFAIVLFIVFGLFIYSFANPDSDTDPIDNGNQNYEQNEDNNNDGNQNVDNTDQQEGDEVNTPGNTVERPGTNPIRLSANYDSLRKAITSGEKIINNPEVKKFLEKKVEELGLNVDEGLSLLEDISVNQDSVDKKAEDINVLINQINAEIDNELEKTVDRGNGILGNILKTSNPTFANALNDLEKVIEDETIKDKTLNDKVLYINNANSLINRANEIEEGLLAQIENAKITLESDTIGWTNQNVILTFNIDIDDELVKSIKILNEADEELELDDNNKVEVKNKGIYTAKVTFADNSINDNVTVNVAIDKTAPSKVSVKAFYEDTNAEYNGEKTNRNVRLDFLTTDGVTSLENMKFQYATSANPTDGKWYDIANYRVITWNLISKHYIRAIDEAGNVGEPSEVVVINVDKTAPSKVTVKAIYADTNVEYNGEKTNKNIRLDFLTTDVVTSLENMKFQFATSANPTDGKWYDIANYRVITWDLISKHYIRAIDEAGNVSEPSEVVVINVDKLAPRKVIVKAFYDNTNDEYNGEPTNKNIRYEFITDDNTTTLENMRFQFATNPNYQDEHWYNVSPRVVNWNLISNEYVRAIDEAGNVSEPSEVVIIRVDKNSPVINNIEVLNYNHMIEGTIPKYYHNDVINIRVDANDNLPGELLYSFGNDDNWKSTNTFTANWTMDNFNIKVKDAVGNIAERIINLSIDKGEMAIEFKNSNDETYNGDRAEVFQNIYIKARNGWDLLESGYLWSLNDKNITKEDILTNGKSFWHNDPIQTPTELGTYYLWVYAKDKNGNEKIERSNAFVLYDSTIADVTNFSELKSALNDNNIKTINLLNNINATQKIYINRPVTINGKGMHIIVTTNLGTNNSTKHAIGINSNDVTIKNLTINNNTKAYGVQAYKVTNILFDNVTIIKSNGSGLMVNGSTVTANNLNVSDSNWIFGSVEVTPGGGVTTPSIFNLTGNGVLSDYFQIYSDERDVTKSFVNADGYSETIIFSRRIWFKN